MSTLITPADVKALHDALIRARLALRVLVPQLLAGEAVSPVVLASLESQYCGEACPVDSLEVVVRSRKQFDDLSVEVMTLSRENTYLREHLRVAREERDELRKTP